MRKYMRTNDSWFGERKINFFGISIFFKLTKKTPNKTRNSYKKSVVGNYVFFFLLKIKTQQQALASILSGQSAGPHTKLSLSLLFPSLSFAVSITKKNKKQQQQNKKKEKIPLGRINNNQKNKHAKQNSSKTKKLYIPLYN